MRNILLVISGPSGVGKGTIVKRLMQGEEAFLLSVSCTTRSPREGEEDGREYFFITREEFERRIKAGAFLEYDEHFEHCYGTLRSFVEEGLRKSSVILEIDVVGALNVKESYPEAVLVILLPPDMKTLKARLKGRESETAEQLAERLARAEYELGQKERFDYMVVNDDLEEAEEALKQIIAIEKNRA